MGNQFDTNLGFYGKLVCRWFECFRQDLTGHLNHKFDGVHILLFQFFLENEAYLIEYFDLLGQELFLVWVSLIEDISHLYLHLPIFAYNILNTANIAQEHISLSFEPPNRMPISPLVDIHFPAHACDKLNNFPRGIGHHIFDLGREAGEEGVHELRECYVIHV